MRRADVSRCAGPGALLLVSLSLALSGTACNSSKEAAGDVGTDTSAEGSDSAAEPETEPETETDPEPETAPESESEVDSETETETEIETAPETETDITPPPTMPEEEPNNGATLTEYNTLALGTTATGAIGTAKDADVFRVSTVPGHVYRAVLTATVSSQLAPHLTVMDAGRGTDAAGEDYVKMAVGPSGPAVVAVLEWLAMGEGGHFVIVRDDRNIAGGSVGSPAHTYELVVTERALADVSGVPLTFPSTFDDALASAGGLRVYAFDGAEGHDIRADLHASGDMDARLFVFATATGDWIARNDDRSGSDVNPLLDAPLTASGAMLLVVENIATDATALGFTLTCQAP